MRIWLSTSPENFTSEYDDIEEMFKQGLTRLILQKNGVNSKFALDHEYERWLMGLSMEFRDNIWVRGTPDLAEHLEVRGCIIDANSLKKEVPENWKRVNCIAMCNHINDLNSLPEWISGALIGPLFMPQSLTFSVNILGTEILKNLDSKVPQIIGFGGIDHENLDEIKKLNLQGISILGGIWNYADPVNAFIKLNRALKRF